MKRNDNLFRLIKSLSKSEKRFFKIYSTRHVIGDQNKYVQLFDAIDKQKIYNEKNIVKKFKDEKFAKRLSVAKAYVYELILKSMNVYHGQNSVEAQLRDLLGNIHFLYQKAMHDQALKLVNKAQKQALLYDMLTFMPEILRWQKKIMEVKFYTQKKEKDLFELAEHYHNILEQLNTINDYWLLQARLYYRQYHKGIVLQNQEELAELAKMLENPLIQEAEKATTYEAKLLRYKFLSTYYFLLRDFPNCYQHSKGLIELLESRPKWLQMNLLLYVNSVNNLLNMTAMLGKNEERAHYIDRLREMMHSKQLKKSESLQIKLFQAYYYHLMTLSINQAAFADGMTFIYEMEKGLQQFKDKMDPMGSVMLCFYGFHICFGAEKYSYAYEWLQQILANPTTEIRRDIYYFAKILSLITAYELQNTTLLRQQILSTYRFLHQQAYLKKFEQIGIRFLRQLHQNTSVEELKQLFVQLQHQFKELVKDNLERKVFAYFDFILWLQSKLNNQPFAQVLKEAGKKS